MRANHSADPIKALKSDIAALRGDLSSLAEDVAGLNKNIGRAAKSQFDEQVDMIGEMCSETADEAAKVARKQVEHARESVQQHPLTSLATAFGLGLIIARFMR